MQPESNVLRLVFSFCRASCSAVSAHAYHAVGGHLPVACLSVPFNSTAIFICNNRMGVASSSELLLPIKDVPFEVWHVENVIN